MQGLEQGQRPAGRAPAGDRFEAAARDFRAVLPAGLEFVSLRLVEERSDSWSIRRGVLEPVQLGVDMGGMVTVHEGGGVGYASTSDLSPSGLRAAIDAARGWARRSAGRAVFDFRSVEMPHPTGSYRTPVIEPWDAVPTSEKIALLREIDGMFPVDPRVVEWSASLHAVRTRVRYLTSGGGDVEQELHHLAPDLLVVAHADGQTQKRGASGRGISQQGGWEVIDRVGLRARAARATGEALALLTAPECPSGRMDLLLDPGQMMLQIHESIGHPLELDRILGDERNYAGTSFVTLDMFGSYQYGSPLLNVTFDPTRADEFASYGWDDEGNTAERCHIIKDGLLLRPLGGVVSQRRAGIAGVANARASSWNRPPIDRMANLNVEPGDKSFDQLVKMVERGVYMESNTSWSIDDSRNKFQFGCEYARLIEDGELKGVVRNSNYRGISAQFWRSLKGVGDAGTLQVNGTPFCGKGEPNQIIRVGHASPACLFADVDVFGGG
jgi:predicted Zn-dependent protease